MRSYIIWNADSKEKAGVKIFYTSNTFQQNVSLVVIDTNSNTIEYRIRPARNTSKKGRNQALWTHERSKTYYAVIISYDSVKGAFAFLAVPAFPLH